MKGRTPIVWKLSAVVVVILAAAIGLSGYATNLICSHYSLECARTFLEFNSDSIINGISRMMMSRDNAAIGKLIEDISQNSSVYGKIRLAAHHSGKVAASRFGGEKAGKLGMGERTCAFCHSFPDPKRPGTGAFYEILDSPRGGRILSITTPVLNGTGCRSADCHVHSSGPSILGLLTAEYSLEQADSLLSKSRRIVFCVLLLAILAGVAGLWFMFRIFLEKPLGVLIAGTKKIAAGDLDFRFPGERNDEIGVLEQSFNSMTDRIKAHQAELHRAKEYLEGIVENSADIIITVNREGLIQTFNKGAEQALGFAREEVIGRKIEMLFADPAERDAAIARLEDTDNIRNVETRFLAKDGRVRSVLLTLSRLRDRQGNPMGTFGISKDVTVEKRLQEQLLQSQKFAAIGQAVTGIQHAIKNMLNALKGGAYLVRSGLSKDDHGRIRDGWDMVEEGIDKITKLSLSMLNYAKEWVPELERTDLAALVERICDLNKRASAEKGVALRFLPAAELPAVLLDPKLIHMALMDIFQNAIDACTWKEYGTGEVPEVAVRVSSCREGDFSVVEVRDNGCGMTAAIRENIFTPFFSTKKKWGTGLGLALTARIINLHGGEISVESEPERGSVFRILLPVDGPKKTRETADGQEGTRDR